LSQKRHFSPIFSAVFFNPNIGPSPECRWQCVRPPSVLKREWRFELAVSSEGTLQPMRLKSEIVRNNTIVVDDCFKL
jgi:hypothetical protein